VTRAGTREDYARRVLRAQQHVEARLDRDVDPHEVARVAGLSVHHFHRVFRGTTGESVMQYARRLRLERAARELLASDASVLDLALGAGYRSHEAFTRAFARAFGMPPSEWRRRGSATFRTTPCGQPVDPPEGVVIRTEAARHLVVLRHQGPFDAVPAAWHTLHAWWAEHAGALGLPQDSGAQPMFGLVPDDPQITDQDLLRYDAAIAVPAPIPRHRLPGGPVGQARLEGGTFAVLSHRGPYDELSDCYVALIGGWLPASGRLPAPTPVVEAYLNSPDRTAPEALRTEIRIRLTPR